MSLNHISTPLRARSRSFIYTQVNLVAEVSPRAASGVAPVRIRVCLTLRSLALRHRWTLRLSFHKCGELLLVHLLPYPLQTPVFPKTLRQQCFCQ